jgi:hypothetical protein
MAFSMDNFNPPVGKTPHFRLPSPTRPACLSACVIACMHPRIRACIHACVRTCKQATLISRARYPHYRLPFPYLRHCLLDFPDSHENFQCVLVSGFRFQVSGFRFHVSGFMSQVSGFRFQGSGYPFLARNDVTNDPLAHMFSHHPLAHTHVQPHTVTSPAHLPCLFVRTYSLPVAGSHKTNLVRAQAS